MPLAVSVVPSIGSTATSHSGPVPSPTCSPLKSIGASSFSPSPMTTTPFIDTVETSCAHRVDRGAVGAVLVTAADPAPGGHRRRLGDPDELESEVAVGCSTPTRSCPGTPASDMCGCIRPRRPDDLTTERHLVAPGVTECARAGDQTCHRRRAGAGRAQATRGSLLAAAREVFARVRVRRGQHRRRRGPRGCERRQPLPPLRRQGRPLPRVVRGLPAAAGGACRIGRPRGPACGGT